MKTNTKSIPLLLASHFTGALLELLSVRLTRSNTKLWGRSENPSSSWGLHILSALLGLQFFGCPACEGAGFVPDNGFEFPDLGPGGFADAPNGSTGYPGWVFSPHLPSGPTIGGPGIAANGSIFGVIGATQGQTSDNSVSTSGQAAFLHNLCSFTENVILPSGTFNVTFGWEARFGYGGNEISVALGNNILFDGTPTTFTSFSPASSAYVTLPAGTYALTFTGKTSVASGDLCTFVDDVSVVAQAPEPASAVLLLSGGALLALRRRRSPAGA